MRPWHELKASALLLWCHRLGSSMPGEGQEQLLANATKDHEDYHGYSPASSPVDVAPWHDTSVWPASLNVLKCCCNFQIAISIPNIFIWWILHQDKQGCSLLVLYAGTKSQLLFEMEGLKLILVQSYYDSNIRENWPTAKEWTTITQEKKNT